VLEARQLFRHGDMDELIQGNTLIGITRDAMMKHEFSPLARLHVRSSLIGGMILARVGRRVAF
jgi:hypothetical protein